ncbi:nudC domain-containing protein 3-like isoform X2 [Montipora capricornis]|uniref:nudC domain-containing protein 3-like isoform X2 n=1 Tax=Montipora capricornis TaxID=246305 RepID=UPI0035F1BCF9
MDSKKFDDVFMGVLQHCEQVETFLDTMFSFLSRRTDFFRVMHSRDDKMGFPPGVAENIVLKVFKRYQEIPYRNETSKRTGKPEARADLPSTLNSTSLASDDCATPSPSETETQPAEAAIEIESSHPHGIQSGPTCSAVAADRVQIYLLSSVEFLCTNQPKQANGKADNATTSSGTTLPLAKIRVPTSDTNSSP